MGNITVGVSDEISLRFSHQLKDNFFKSSYALRRILLRIKIHETFNVSFIDLIKVARLKDIWKTRGRGRLEQFGTAEQILESLSYFTETK